ncbi:hypothetical protein UFOVP434_98 [uncultured Caudovirales phage]|uniref:Uncharacterized protein n=1 Tax=uncultured Caudovirales phage TaxID=2100421 RepID=A0A6J5MDV1_9CAUD|nr:hypothetical protein UFOVP434_98 [uncultured Caudovirales phage]
MNAEYKALWLAALRGNEYKQGQGRLKTVTTGGPVFCCLGVLCDIAVKRGETSWDSIHLHSGKERTLSMFEYIPKELAPKFGIEYNGKIPRQIANNTFVESLAECNDQAQLSFPQIADIIEKEL